MAPSSAKRSRDDDVELELAPEEWPYGPKFMVYNLAFVAWYRAKVVSLKDQRVRVRYLGWGHDDDEWIPVLSDRFDFEAGGKKKWKAIAGAAGAFKRCNNAEVPKGVLLDTLPEPEPTTSVKKKVRKPSRSSKGATSGGDIGVEGSEGHLPNAQNTEIPLAEGMPTSLEVIGSIRSFGALQPSQAGSKAGASLLLGAAAKVTSLALAAQASSAQGQILISAGVEAQQQQQQYQSSTSSQKQAPVPNEFVPAVQDAEGTEHRPTNSHGSNSRGGGRQRKPAKPVQCYTSVNSDNATVGQGNSPSGSRTHTQNDFVAAAAVAAAAMDKSQHAGEVASLIAPTAINDAHKPQEPAKGIAEQPSLLGSHTRAVEAVGPTQSTFEGHGSIKQRREGMQAKAKEPSKPPLPPANGSAKSDTQTRKGVLHPGPRGVEAAGTAGNISCNRRHDHKGKTGLNIDPKVGITCSQTSLDPLPQSNVPAAGSLLGYQQDTLQEVLQLARKQQQDLERYLQDVEALLMELGPLPASVKLTHKGVKPGSAHVHTLNGLKAIRDECKVLNSRRLATDEALQNHLVALKQAVYDGKVQSLADDSEYCCLLPRRVVGQGGLGSGEGETARKSAMVLKLSVQSYVDLPPGTLLVMPADSDTPRQQQLRQQQQQQLSQDLVLVPGPSVPSASNYLSALPFLGDMGSHQAGMGGTLFNPQQAGGQFSYALPKQPSQLVIDNQQQQQKKARSQPADPIHMGLTSSTMGAIQQFNPLQCPTSTGHMVEGKGGQIQSVVGLGSSPSGAAGSLSMNPATNQGYQLHIGLSLQPH